MTTLTLSPARPKVRPSISTEDDTPTAIRVFDGEIKLGETTPVTIEWPEPLRGLIRDVYVEIARTGRANRIEVDAAGMEWHGALSFSEIHDGAPNRRTARTVMVGDSLCLTVHLPVDGI